jgi:7-cyano-7-deazaguanine synthase
MNMNHGPSKFADSQIGESLFRDHPNIIGLENAVADSAALVPTTGGIDSTVVLYLLLTLGFDVYGLEHTYPGKPSIASARIRRLCDTAGVPLLQVSYPQKAYRLSAPRRVRLPRLVVLTESNMLYYSLAANIAHSLGIKYVFGGQIKPDWSSPDGGQCQPDYYSFLNQLISTEFGPFAPKIFMPLIFMEKLEVIKLGLHLRVPLEITWSCSTSDDEACGSCDKCQGRRDAFIATGLEFS